MNPSIVRTVIERALEEDEPAARAEYFAEFRRDIESYIDIQLVKSLVAPGRIELPCIPGIHYEGFADPAGGGGKDSYTLAIVHAEKSGVLVVDVVREVKPPFSPEATTKEFAETFKAYGIHRIKGDRYAGSWPAEQFQKHGIAYEPSEKVKSEIYKDALPLFNSRQVELLDNPRLIGQLSGLERRTARGGNDSIDHAPNSHDDVINAVAGALVLAQQPKQSAAEYGQMVGTLRNPEFNAPMGWPEF